MNPHFPHTAADSEGGDKQHTEYNNNLLSELRVSPFYQATHGLCDSLKEKCPLQTQAFSSQLVSYLGTLGRYGLAGEVCHWDPALRFNYFVYGCFACMYVYIPCAFSTCKSQKRVLDPPELQLLQMVESPRRH